MNRLIWVIVFHRRSSVEIEDNVKQALRLLTET